jgi:hypothetical protein
MLGFRWTWRHKVEVTVVFDSSNSHASRVRSAVSQINGSQRFFRIHIKNDEGLAATGCAVNPKLVCSSYESQADGKRSIVITEDPLDDNWFSHEYRTCAIITTADWEIVFAPPSLKAYLIFQMAQGLIHFAADMSEEMAMNLVHEPPQGCVYDLAVNKHDLKLGMVAGNICQTCIAKLRTLGTPEQAIDAIAKMLALVRSEALGQAIVLDPQEVFVVMRFTNNDENDNAWKHGIKKGIESLGLKAVRSDDHVVSGQMLDKINNHIGQSRLVVAKVDEDNLNVFYELGLAMGLRKDVLLISESSLVMKLPSDLRNWECLTYPKGDYEELLIRVSKFLQNNYGAGTAEA